LENAIEQRRLGSPAIFFPSETESEFETKVKCELPTFAFVLCGQLVGWLVEIGTPGVLGSGLGPMASDKLAILRQQIIQISARGR